MREDIAEALREVAAVPGYAARLVQGCLDAAGSGEGSRVFTEVFEEDARRAAQRVDERVRQSAAPRALEGIPISVKDLFDVRGTVTRAGSRAQPDRSPAVADSWVVQRLRAAGAVIIGKTNMTEFAYSGLGLNPQFGTPSNPFDRAARRLPGGSSSGAAVSVTDGMALAGIGTDTGGSVRIPAALCGLVGWKPTASRIPMVGVLPLSPSLDSVGPIASSVASCIRLDEVLSGVKVTLSETYGDLSGLRFAVASGLFGDTDVLVARAMERSLSALSRAGAQVIESPLREISEVISRAAGPVIVAAEAYAWHRANLELHGESYDPRVRSRIENGRNTTAWEYLDALNCRASSIQAAGRALEGFDAWLMPTVPIIAPKLSECDADEDYYRLNRLLLRNPSVVNFLDGCAVSLPCHRQGDAPVGITVAGLHRSDGRILALAQAIEHLLQGDE